MLFAYFGPETVLPFASILATVLGVVMMFGRMSLRMMWSPFRWVICKAKGQPSGALRGPTAWRKGGPVEARKDTASRSAGDSGEA